jgi:phosphopentomutase
VLQIACHEETFGLAKLYQLCELARGLVDAYHVGRVIARPFLGSHGQYYRTGNRRDYATPPPAPTLLDHLIAAQGQVIAIGKVADIYAHRGISKSVKASKNENLFNAFLAEATVAPNHSITFVNLVDFDMEYGHRRNVVGYAKALEDFDSWLPTFFNCLRPGDLAVITADHGCDPTAPGSDHTREHVPVLFFGPHVLPQSLGTRPTFADIGQTIAGHLGLPPLSYGTACLLTK